VGEAVTTGASAVGREHPAPRHKQATSRVKAIFFMMAKQQEAWGARALEDEHFLRGRRICAGKSRSLFQIVASIRSLAPISWVWH
jgi:hypothetical protein